MTYPSEERPNEDKTIEDRMIDEIETCRNDSEYDEDGFLKEDEDDLNEVDDFLKLSATALKEKTKAGRRSPSKKDVKNEMKELMFSPTKKRATVADENASASNKSQDASKCDKIESPEYSKAPRKDINLDKKGKPKMAERRKFPSDSKNRKNGSSGTSKKCFFC